MNIQLKGKKVTLRDFTKDDIQRMWYWEYEANDREHIQWNGPYFPREQMSMEEYTKNYIYLLEEVNNNQTRSKLVIEKDGEFIGSVGWYWVSEATKWCENGLVIYDSRYWSGGFGFDAYVMWTDYLFTEMDIARIGISTWSGNERMIRLAKKCGMIEEARIRKARIVNDTYFDSIKMGILREEWELIRKQLLDYA
ncbi:GNAT family N-acetyltransferase [Bacillus solimangrovi]|uniref:GNAT family N-acetyltransferase n=1 Tax=Bacillus solimangrovi TaxID=1305675 RepID=A0A1E5LJ00_9BACI|nr:GNAT family protein [Bacillus solimangrovi]OEH94041.1 GNAT family N-acetyltransferase [Bacillus solimangrovi]